MSKKNKSLQYSAYHSFLRIIAVVIAVVLVFDSGLISEKTSKLSISTQEYLASVVGVTVGVAPTEVNLLTARITELETELAAKEREINVNLNSETSTPVKNDSTIILSVILFILLILIIINYVLDYRRGNFNLRPNSQLG